MLRLTKERIKRGWSKSELSRRSGVGLVEISRIENGKIFPYPKWRHKLAMAMGMPEHELFKEVDGVESNRKGAREPGIFDCGRVSENV